MLPFLMKKTTKIKKFFKLISTSFRHLCLDIIVSCTLVKYF